MPRNTRGAPSATAGGVALPPRSITASTAIESSLAPAAETPPAAPINGAAPRPILADYVTADDLARELGITERHLAERHRAGLAPPRTVVGRAGWLAVAGRPRLCRALRRASQGPP